MTEPSRAAIIAPLFATVTFTNDLDEPVHTFRVPLSESTTVRRLAKDALQRLYHSTRSTTNKDAQPSDFLVREVRVGEHKAEIFAQDLVLHVVAVREEKIFMKLGNKTLSSGLDGSASTAAAQPSVVAPPQPSSVPLSSVSPPQPCATSGGLLESERSMDLTTASFSSKWAAETAAQKSKHGYAQQQQAQRLEAPPTVKSSTAVFVRSPSPARVETPRIAASSPHPSVPGHKKPADATIIRTAAKKVDSIKTSPKKPHRLAGEQVTPEAARVINTENLTARQAAKLKEKKNSDSTLQWGSSAFSLFPTNYYSNPDDARKAHRREAAARPTVSAVAREVFGSVSDDDADERAKIVFDAPIDVTDVDATPSATTEERPEGWGSEALKYFPPTYASDPKKAKLTEEEMNEPRRTRRRVEVNYTW
jgi:hypothetical protein